MKKEKVFFGSKKDSKEKIYLDSPSFDCGWYWSFGYLGNRNCHYHLSNYQNGRNINMHDALLADYDLNPKIKDNLWLFCELSLTAYSLKQTAEVLGRCGSHISYNPCCELIKNTDEVNRINEVVLPAIFAEIDKLLK